MVIAAKPESVIVATNVKKFSGLRANSNAEERSDAESTGSGFGALGGLSSSVISARAVLVTPTQDRRFNGCPNPGHTISNTIANAFSASEVPALLWFLNSLPPPAPPHASRARDCARRTGVWLCITCLKAAAEAAAIFGNAGGSRPQQKAGKAPPLRLLRGRAAPGLVAQWS